MDRSQLYGGSFSYSSNHTSLFVYYATLCILIIDILILTIILYAHVAYENGISQL